MLTRKRSLGAAVVLLPALLLVLAPASSPAGEEVRTYSVTIQNLTSGQPFTPPIIVTHQGGTKVFRVGFPATEALQQVAENGNSGPLIDALSNDPKVWAFDEATAPLVPGSDPGGTGLASSVSFVIEAGPGAQHLTALWMLICTNDGFSGLDRAKLPANGSVVYLTNAYDAGTEINTEDFADLVPPCQALMGVSSDDPGTGVTNPALAENGVILPHPGIQGGNDLDPAVHGWIDPVAKVTITRVDMDADKFVAPLSGAGEVVGGGGGDIGFVDSAATGLARFKLNKAGDELRYSLVVDSIVDAVQSHIHLGPPDVNAPVVVFLFGPSAPGGLFSGQLASGVITESDLIGPLAGDFDALVEALRTGSAYVNVHTVANPGGEIRGQVGVQGN